MTKKLYKYRAKGFKLSTKNHVWISKAWRTSFADAKLDATLADKRKFSNISIKRVFWKNVNTKLVSGTKKEKKALKRTYKKLSRDVKKVKL